MALTTRPTVRLSNSMRDWLRDPANSGNSALFYDFVLGFQREFQLMPEDTSRLLAQWVLEVYGHPERKSRPSATPPA